MPAKIKPPAGLDRAQRREFRCIMKAVVAAGIDPRTRISIVGELAAIDARIEKLRAAAEAATPGPARLAVERLLAAALAEKRKLHAAAFLGSARRVYHPPAPASEEPPEPGIATERDPLVAGAPDHGWWTARAKIAQLPAAEQAAAYASAEAELGRPSWRVLLHNSESELAESAAAIRGYSKRGNGTAC